MNNIEQTITHRTEMVLGPRVMKRLSEIKVIIFGVGGVGSWCAESLIRSGLKHLTIVDSDIICATNINRQCEATSINIGKVKVDEMKKRLLEINPSAEITALHCVYDETTHNNFNLESYDFIIDAIDSLKNKIHLIEQCVKMNLKIFSSMGAGAKTDPLRIKADRIENTVNCPLARHVRRELRKRNISQKVICVYSDELPVEPKIASICGSNECSCTADRAEYCDKNKSELVDWCSRKKRINGAMVHITAIFGFTLAGLVINTLVKQDADSPIQ